MPLLTARSTSRITCGELLEWEEKTRTKDTAVGDGIDDCLTQEAPGVMSRGAIQQRILFVSKVAQTASATALSLDEQLMKNIICHRAVYHIGGVPPNHPFCSV